MKLLVNALVKYLLGLLMVGALLFVSAGGFDYFGGWLFLLLLFVPMFFLGVVLYCRAPALLEKRLAGLLFFVGFITAGLDARFGWSEMPLWCTAAASVILLMSYATYIWVMRVNAFLSRTVEVQEHQTVVDTGPYAVVRHPMYAATVGLFLSIPIVLGSWWALLCFLPYVAVIAIRIENEEKVLCSGLAGYTEYQKRVRYKMIPFLW